MSEEHPFYGDDILREKEQIYIQSLLAKFKREKPSQELKKKIYEVLMKEKHLGNVKIPFKVVYREGKKNLSPPYVEVVLDTKV